MEEGGGVQDNIGFKVEVNKGVRGRVGEVGSSTKE